MRILGLPRTWFTVAAVWAALLDVLVLAHGDSSAPALTAVWLAVPVVAAVVALVTLSRRVAMLCAAAYVLIALLAILSVGLFLGPGILAMVMGAMLVGAAPAGE